MGWYDYAKRATWAVTNTEGKTIRVLGTDEAEAKRSARQHFSSKGLKTDIKSIKKED